MTARVRETGQAGVEMLLALPLALCLIVATLEFAQIYRARATLAHATEMAARAGALNHGCKAAMYHQLASSLTPLLMRGERSPQRLAWASADAHRWVRIYSFIETLHPHRKTFERFAESSPLSPAQIAPCANSDDDGSLRAFHRNRVIPNDNLMHRNARRYPVTHQGQSASLSIQDANLLKIQVHYCHKLSVPLLSHLLVALQQWNGKREASPFWDFCARGTGGRGASPYNEKLLVLNAQATVRMQTPFMQSSLQD